MPSLAKTTSYVFKGDEQAARKLIGLANLQLMKLRNLMTFNKLDQYGLTIYNKVGAYIKVTSVFGNEVAEVFYPKLKLNPEEVIKKKHLLRMKNSQDWTILYAPCPLPDPQDWGGWIESGKTDIDADNFLNMFALISFGWPVWGDFEAVGNLNYVVTNPAASQQYGGWWGGGYSNVGGLGGYFGPLVFSIYVDRIDRVLSSQQFTYTFIGDLIPSIQVSNWNESGYKRWHGGGGYHSKGFVDIPSNPAPAGLGCSAPPPYVSPPTERTILDKGYLLTHGEGYISWQSAYMLGFWKQEWTSYNPSSYLDNDNYVLFYDKYVYDSSYSSTKLDDYSGSVTEDYEEWFWPGEDGYYTYWWTEQTRNEYVSWGLTGNGNHVFFPVSQVGTHLYIKDPDGDGTNSTRGQIIYETHMCGKYEGQWFDEIIGSAIWTGTSVWGTTGFWSGDNVFPFMGRFYSKSSLKEGTTDDPDKTSDHNLLLVSYLVGPAAGNPSDTDKIPGCTGITKTVYKMRHGSTNITKEYAASHPGWHPVWTDLDTERIWRSYGDLFAGLKTTEIKEVEIGPPEWMDWWLADGSQFIIEEEGEI